MAINLTSIKQEIETLVDQLPQKAALLQKAVHQFEEGLRLIGQAGYDAKELLAPAPASSALPAEAGAPEAPEVEEEHE